MTKHVLKKLTVVFLSSSLVLLNAQVAVKPETKSNPNLIDSLTMSTVSMLATNLNGYAQTNDVSLATAGGSAFIAGEVLVTVENKDINKVALDEFNNPKILTADQKQAEALVVLKDSYQTVYEASTNKLVLQQAAAASFAAAEVVALKLAEKEKTKEKKCFQAIQLSLTTVADGVSKVCSELANDPEKSEEAQGCSDELAACSGKIKSDMEEFEGYIKTRNTPIASIAGFTKVAGLRDVFVGSLGGTSAVCSNYAQAMAASEASGDCIKKVEEDEKNESSGKLNPKVDGDLLSLMGIDAKSSIAFITVAGKSISKDFDQSMLIPEHRSILWGGMKELANASAAATLAEIVKIKVILVKVDKYLQDLGKLTGTDGDAAKKGELPWTEQQIKDYLATNPSVEDIQKKLAGLNATQIAKIYKVIGDNQADIAKLDKAKSGLDSIPTNNGMHISNAQIKAFFATGPTEAQQIAKAKQLGLTPIEMTKAYFIGMGVDINRVTDAVLETKFYENSVALGKDMGPPWAPKSYYSLTKGEEVQASELKEFFASNPSDSQILGKASELGLGIGAMTSLMKVVGANQYDMAGSSDSKYGSLYNRLNTSLFQGRDGYSLDEQRHIIKGGGKEEIKEANGVIRWEPRTTGVVPWTPVVNPNGIYANAIGRKGKTNAKTNAKSKNADIKLDRALPCVTVNIAESCASFSKSLNSTSLQSMSEKVKTQVNNVAKLIDTLNGAKKFTRDVLVAAKAVGVQSSAINAEIAKMKTGTNDSKFMDSVDALKKEAK